MSSDPGAVRSSEAMEVWDRRFEEARRAGLTYAQAVNFADSNVDVGTLRRLVRMGCPAHLIARIVKT